MKLGVKILPKGEVLDTQGRTVQETLSDHGFKLSQCRVGRFVEIEVEENDPSQAIQKVDEIAKFVLYNPLIETYSVEVVES